MPVPHPGPTPEPPAAHALPPDQAFAFHRTMDPELWRTTLPLIVRLRCGRHKGLISTWLAIHWLVTLYSGREDAAFGLREIAEEAGVGRNELAGPGGHIQRLLALGLVQIVGYQTVRRGLKPCPIYHIDLAELERQSIEAIQGLLRDRGLPPPPRSAPDPRQLALFGPPAAGAAPDADGPGAPPGMPPAGDAWAPSPAADVAPPRATHGAGDASRFRGDAPVCPESGTGATARNRASPPPMHESGTEAHESGTGAHESGTDSARKRDTEGEKEGEHEGARAHTRDVYQEVAEAVIATLQRQGLIRPALVAPAEAAPAGEPPLPDKLFAIWQGDRGAISARDRHQLQMLAAEHDGATGGHGAYWVGRAVLIADRCLAERGQPLTVNYLRGMLRRWQREGSWGSDREGEAGDAAATPARASLPPGAPPPPRVARDGSCTPVRPAPSPADAPPAVAAYTAAFRRTPNAVQAEQIVATVTDVAAWRQVLTDWQANGWKEGAVANMLDRYRKVAGAPATDGPPVSVTVIHRYPGLSDQQRDRWIARFHAAAAPAEKRAVIRRLEQEHPR